MSIIINLEKAKAIKQNIVREQRAPLLADLDIAYMRAVEQGDTAKQQEIAAKKQALRDVTKSPLILEAKTVDELAAADPIAELG